MWMAAQFAKMGSIERPIAADFGRRIEHAAGWAENSSMYSLYIEGFQQYVDSSGESTLLPAMGLFVFVVELGDRFPSASLSVSESLPAAERAQFRDAFFNFAKSVCDSQPIFAKGGISVVDKSTAAIVAGLAPARSSSSSAAPEVSGPVPRVLVVHKQDNLLMELKSVIKHREPVVVKKPKQVIRDECIRRSKAPRAMDGSVSSRLDKLGL